MEWSVPTCCYAQSGVEVVYEGENGCVAMKRMEIGCYEAKRGNDDDEKATQPIDMPMPISPRHGRLGDMKLSLVMAFSKGCVVLDVLLGLGNICL